MENKIPYRKSTWRIGLRHMLVDITAEDDECPEAVKRSDWEGDIEIDGEELVVTLHAGPHAES